MQVFAEERHMFDECVARVGVLVDLGESMAESVGTVRLGGEVVVAAVGHHRDVQVVVGDQAVQVDHRVAVAVTGQRRVDLVAGRRVPGRLAGSGEAGRVG
jgi:hypothetical protein